MSTAVNASRCTIPISEFNLGRAGQIFESVKAEGAKVVMKDNVAECVLLSPDEYVRMMDELEDARLLSMAEERLARFDPATLIPEEEVWARLGITQEDLDSVGEVEFE